MNRRFGARAWHRDTSVPWVLKQHSAVWTASAIIERIETARVQAPLDEPQF
jgi:hypothetical protein